MVFIPTFVLWCFWGWMIIGFTTWFHTRLWLLLLDCCIPGNPKCFFSPEEGRASKSGPASSSRYQIQTKIDSFILYDLLSSNKQKNDQNCGIQFTYDGGVWKIKDPQVIVVVSVLKRSNDGDLLTTILGNTKPKKMVPPMESCQRSSIWMIFQWQSSGVRAFLYSCELYSEKPCESSICLIQSDPMV